LSIVNKKSYTAYL